MHIVLKERGHAMKKSSIIVGFLLSSFLVSGLVEALWPSNAEVALLVHGFSIAFMLFWWVGEHASENGLAKSPRGAKFLAALLPLFGLPYYFYFGYGFKLGTIKLLLALLVSVFAIALYLISFYAVHQFET